VLFELTRRACSGVLRRRIAAAQKCCFKSACYPVTLSRNSASDALIDEAIQYPAVVFGEQDAPPEREIDTAIIDGGGGGEAATARTTDHRALGKGEIRGRKDRHNGDGNDRVDDVSHGFLACNGLNGTAGASSLFARDGHA
jgi:hypothetical protein